MTIKLTNAGKRFNRDWIFNNINYEFLPSSTYAITGANGSGKSTLLQALCGSLTISEGKIEWSIIGKQINADNIYQHLSIAAPYIEVVEEMTAIEFLQFHSHFKPLQPAVSIKQIIEIVGLQKSANKQIRYYSSGMKQRIKLAQAIFADSSLLLLDEPCTNLDKAGIELYQQLITNYTTGKTIIVSSNDIVEYSFCKEVINMADFK